jgi:hypothetical protein
VHLRWYLSINFDEDELDFEDHTALKKMIVNEDKEVLGCSKSLLTKMFSV